MEHRALTDLLWRLLLCLDVEGEASFQAYDLARLPAEAFPRLLATGLFTRSTNATGLLCDGCDEGCWVVPERSSRAGGGQHLTAGCVGPRPDIGMLTFPSDRLVTWRLDPARLTQVLAEAGGLRGPVAEVVPGRLWRLGTLGAGRSRRPVLLAPGLARRLPEERVSLLDQCGPGRPVVLVPREVPSDVPPERATVVPLSEVLLLEPDGLFLDLEAVAAPTAPARRSRVPLHLPAGTAWESVHLRVMDDENLQVVVGGQVVPRSYLELGLVDGRRREPTPNATWAFLLALARSGGSMTWREDAADDANRKRVSELREALKTATGLQADPFLPYAPGRGWAPRFGLVDLRDRA